MFLEAVPAEDKTMKKTTANQMHAAEPALTPYLTHSQAVPFAKELSFFVLTLFGFAAMMTLLVAS